jgi:hypothetical protein
MARELSVQTLAEEDTAHTLTLTEILTENDEEEHEIPLSSVHLNPYQAVPLTADSTLIRSENSNFQVDILAIQDTCMDGYGRVHHLQGCGYE